MSKDFASFMSSISGESSEQRIQELMEILDKVMQIIINSVDQLSERIFKLENTIHTMAGRVTKLETRPVSAVSASQQAAGATTGPAASAASAAPKPAPKPTSPISARAALQSELKALFNKRKQG
ncbi:MAG: hypothetical protein ACFFD2_12360 [Promethearchaeota archaeon]